jgi:hypothetical protein
MGGGYLPFSIRGMRHGEDMGPSAGAIRRLAPGGSGATGMALRGASTTHLAIVSATTDFAAIICQDRAVARWGACISDFDFADLLARGRPIRSIDGRPICGPSPVRSVPGGSKDVLSKVSFVASSQKPKRQRAPGFSPVLVHGLGAVPLLRSEVSSLRPASWRTSSRCRGPSSGGLSGGASMRRPPSALPTRSRNQIVGQTDLQAARIGPPRAAATCLPRTRVPTTPARSD